MRALASILTALLLLGSAEPAAEPNTGVATETGVYAAQGRMEPGAPAEGPDISMVAETNVLAARDILTVEADEGLTVLGWNAVLTTEGRDEFTRYLIYAEIRNDSDRAVYLAGNTLFYDREGTLISDCDEEAFSPRLLEPGQTAYLGENYSSLVWGSVDVDELGSMTLVIRDDHDLFFKETGYDLPVAMAYQRDCVSVSEAELPEWYDESLKARRLTYVNDTGMMLRNPSLAVGFYDAQGQLLYVLADHVGTTFKERPWYLPEGSACVVDAYIDEAATAYLDWLGDEAAEYHSVVYSRMGL